MPFSPVGPRSITGQPRRLAAVGGAVGICLLTISSAFGLSLPGTASADGSNASGGASARQQGNPARQAQLGSADLATRSVQPGAEADGSDRTTAGGPPRVGHPSVALPVHSGQGKRIVFDVSAQRVWLVGGANQVVRTYLVSGSTFHNLDVGTYHVYSRSRTATAYNSDESLAYMVRFAYGRTAPIGFHAIPVLPNGKRVESRAGLGKPASHGCIRQWITDARALWNFAPIGTTVVVTA